MSISLWRSSLIAVITLRLALAITPQLLMRYLTCISLLNQHFCSGVSQAPLSDLLIITT